MLNQLNIKKKYALIAASIVLLLAAYQFAFKRTIEALQLYHNLKQQVQLSGDLSYQPGYLERKNHNLDKIIALYKADTANFRSNVLSTISSIAQQENVALSEVPSQDPVYHSAQYIIEKLSFEGDYFALERTFNKLQATDNTGIIRSVAIKSVGKHTAADDSKKIVMEVYFEMVKN